MSISVTMAAVLTWHPQPAESVLFIDRKGLMNAGIFAEFAESVCATVTLGLLYYPTSVRMGHPLSWSILFCPLNRLSMEAV